MTKNEPVNETAKAAESVLEDALESISEFSSGDAEHAAHIAIIRVLWECIPVDARPVAAAAIIEIVAESKDIRY